VNGFPAARIDPEENCGQIIAIEFGDGSIWAIIGLSMPNEYQEFESTVLKIVETLTIQP
jgi:hypothetical protein